MAVGPNGAYHLNVGIASGASVSDAVNMAMWRTATIQVPTAITNTTLTYQTTNTVDSSGDPTTWKAAEGPTGTAVAVVTHITGGTYRVPDDVKDAHYWRIMAGGTAQAAARTFKVILKT